MMATKRREISVEREAELAKTTLLLDISHRARYSDNERFYRVDAKDIQARTMAEPSLTDIVEVAEWIEAATADIHYLLVICEELRRSNAALARAVRGGAKR